MKTPISMRIEADLLEAARGAAASEHRSLANLIEVALAERIGFSLEDRRMEVLVPEGAAKLRGAKIVPAAGQTADDVARAQASFDRLLDIADASERRGKAGSPRRRRSAGGR